ncbi:MAG: RNA polymerase factor sigma-32 [Rickettsiales bacterium]|nr:RNA polymerase factor sigma-32 [Rickettsiales bacterium]
MMLTTLERCDALSKYLCEIYKIPMLTDREEREYALLKDSGDLDAAKMLISSHLRLVVKIAFKYQNYGLPIMDMISEGNIGLMKAVKEFSLEKGCKLATYAMWWIKAAIQDYILKSWSLVKIGTTVTQKKLFFNLSKIKNKILSYEHRHELSNSNIKYIASELNVDEKDVIEMDQRMFKKDISLNKKNSRVDDESREIGELIPSKYGTPENVLMYKNDSEMKQNLLKRSFGLLNDREREILFSRKLNENPVTLKELSQKYGISGERIRQIEENAIKKIQNYVITNYNDGNNC